MVGGRCLVPIAVIVVGCPVIIVVTIVVIVVVTIVVFVVGCPIIIVVIAAIVLSFVVVPVGISGSEVGPSILVKNCHDCLFVGLWAPSVLSRSCFVWSWCADYGRRRLVLLLLVELGAAD